MLVMKLIIRRNERSARILGWRMEFIVSTVRWNQVSYRERGLQPVRMQFTVLLTIEQIAGKFENTGIETFLPASISF